MSLPLRLFATSALGGILAATSVSPSDPLLGPGVSKELAVQRAALLSNVRYDLRLTLTARDSAPGSIVVRFRAKRAADVILDFRGRRLNNVRVNGAAHAGVAFNGAHLRVPAAAIRAGENAIAADFVTPIAPAGASIIRFHDDKDGADYLYTLLVPSDANLLFPSFDQPDLKARMTLALTVPRGWQAIANGRTRNVDSSGTTVDYHFNETDPLPTYLFAFAAGPWKRASAPASHAPFWVRNTRAAEVETDSIQSQVASALTSLENYFGVPYPFQQFQHVLSPAFPFGGMEHPGVTMFNEESFIYREPPTINQRLGRRATIYHEVAHHWFGDYVTMRWFDDLWLKEGFATYMAAKMQDIEGLPNPWMSFYLRNKPAAYDVDQTSGTTPVWQQLDNLDQAKSNYGAIVYNKAPSILKQLNYLVGDRNFRAGVHDFLVKHAYGNATWRDLLDAIGKASNRSLTDWGRQYILRPGMPILDQRIDVEKGKIKRLVLIQRPAQKLSGRGVWPIKTEVALWSHNAVAKAIPVEIRAETTVVAAATGMPAPDFVFANYNDNAYGLVMLDGRSVEWLEQNIGGVKDQLLRAMLWGAMWDLVRDAKLAPSRYITMALRELPTEYDEQIAAGIIARMSRATSTYLSDAQRAAVVNDVERMLVAGANAQRAYGMRKSHLDAFIGLAQTPVAIARLEAWLDSASAAGMPLRQPTRWAIVTRLIERGVPNANALFEAEVLRDTTANGKRSAFVARVAAPNPILKREYFTRFFGDTALNEDWVTSSLRSFNAPDQTALTREYLVPALDSLPWIQKNRRIFFLGSWLGGFIGGQRSPQALAEIDAFLARRPNLPKDLRQKILQTRDDLERTVRIRAAFVPST
jgi:aminopeptidase N